MLKQSLCKNNVDTIQLTAEENRRLNIFSKSISPKKKPNFTIQESITLAYE